MAAAEHQAQIRIANLHDYPGHVNDRRILHIAGIVAHPSHMSLILRSESDDLEYNPAFGYRTKIPIVVRFPGEAGIRIFLQGTVGDVTGGGDRGHFLRISGPLPPLVPDHPAPGGGGGGSPMIISDEHSPPMVGGRRRTRSRRQRRTTRR